MPLRSAAYTALHRRDPSLLVDRTAALVRENTALKAAVELRDRKITQLVDEVRMWAAACSLPPAQHRIGMTRSTC